MHVFCICYAYQPWQGICAVGVHVCENTHALCCGWHITISTKEHGECQNHSDAEHALQGHAVRPQLLVAAQAITGCITKDFDA